RSRKALKDAGKALGREASACLERADGTAVEHRSEPAHDDEPGDDPIEPLGKAGDEVQGAEETEDEERAREKPPRPPDPTILGGRGRTSRWSLGHGRKDALRDPAPSSRGKEYLRPTGRRYLG